MRWCEYFWLEIWDTKLYCMCSTYCVHCQEAKSRDILSAEGNLEVWGDVHCTTHSFIIGREVLILTLSILLNQQGGISWYIPRFPSALEMSLGLRPWDISRASGNLLVVGDVQPNTSLLSAVYVYNKSFLSAVYGYNNYTGGFDYFASIVLFVINFCCASFDVINGYN